MNGGDTKDGLLSLVEAQHKIHDRFSNIKRLGIHGGHGNFSLIFTATDTQTGETVVLKVFHPFEREQYRWESFKRESSLLQLLKGKEGIIDLISPIAQFTQVLEVEPQRIKIPVEFSYYVVEQADGDIEETIELGKIDTEEKLLIFRQMCKAVQRIHAVRIVHRDLTPGNFLLMRDGTVRLSDFGTARPTEDSSKPILDDYAGLPPGDVRYTAPMALRSGGRASRPIPAAAPAATTTVYSCQKTLCFSAMRLAIARHAATLGRNQNECWRESILRAGFLLQRRF